MRIFGRKQRNSTAQRRSPSLPDVKASTYTYHSSRRRAQSPTDSDRVGSRKRNGYSDIVHSLRQRLIPSIVLAALFVGCGYILTLESQPKIVYQDSDQSNSILHSTDAYSSHVDGFISKSLVNRSKLTFDIEGLKESVRQEFPEVAAVSVTVPIISRQPVVSLRLTEPAFIIVSGAQMSVVGSNGVALAYGRDVSNLDQLNLPIIQDDSGLEFDIGKPALPRDQAYFISVIYEQLHIKGIAVKNLLIPASPYDLYVYIEGVPYFVKFNILEDPRQQVGSLIAVKNKLDSEGSVPAEYIDVRAGERVFYR